jgi:hypothetical protein
MRSADSNTEKHACARESSAIAALCSTTPPRGSTHTTRIHSALLRASPSRHPAPHDTAPAKPPLSNPPSVPLPRTSGLVPTHGPLSSLDIIRASPLLPGWKPPPGLPATLPCVAGTKEHLARRVIVHSSPSSPPPTHTQTWAGPISCVVASLRIHFQLTACHLPYI